MRKESESASDQNLGLSNNAVQVGIASANLRDVLAVPSGRPVVSRSVVAITAIPNRLSESGLVV